MSSVPPTSFMMKPKPSKVMVRSEGYFGPKKERLVAVVLSGHVTRRSELKSPDTSTIGFFGAENEASTCLAMSNACGDGV